MSQMDTLIENATREVEMGGTAASDRATLLAGFGWLAGKLTSYQNTRRTRRQVVVAVGTPLAFGGGLVAFVLALLERILS